MSSKISGRHTRRQKKLAGGFLGEPYPQPTCTTLQWLWGMGRCPPQVYVQGYGQYGGKSKRRGKKGGKTRKGGKKGGKTYRNKK